MIGVEEEDKLEEIILPSDDNPPTDYAAATKTSKKHSSGGPPSGYHGASLAQLKSGAKSVLLPPTAASFLRSSPFLGASAHQSIPSRMSNEDREWIQTQNKLTYRDLIDDNAVRASTVRELVRECENNLRKEIERKTAELYTSIAHIEQMCKKILDGMEEMRATPSFTWDQVVAQFETYQRMFKAHEERQQIHVPAMPQYAPQVPQQHYGTYPSHAHYAQEQQQGDMMPLYMVRQPGKCFFLNNPTNISINILCVRCTTTTTSDDAECRVSRHSQVQSAHASRSKEHCYLRRCARRATGARGAVALSSAARDSSRACAVPCN
jgi:hypothetical protein